MDESFYKGAFITICIMFISLLVLVVLTTNKDSNTIKQQEIQIDSLEDKINYLEQAKNLITGNYAIDSIYFKLAPNDTIKQGE